jgi:hypothetical protein
MLPPVTGFPCRRPRAGIDDAKGHRQRPDPRQEVSVMVIIVGILLWGLFWLGIFRTIHRALDSQ